MAVVVVQLSSFGAAAVWAQDCWDYAFSFARELKTLHTLLQPLLTCNLSYVHLSCLLALDGPDGAVHHFCAR
jgi:hypothetical protein